VVAVVAVFAVAVVVVIAAHHSHQHIHTRNMHTTHTIHTNRLARAVLLGSDDALRDARLKLIPRIVEGNWIVRRACPPTPAILGAKLKQHHFRGDK
jgi:hypothetical protein